jgi:cobalt-zinc-cadmium efflux system membrane fusion protein
MKYTIFHIALSVLAITLLVTSCSPKQNQPQEQPKVLKQEVPEKEDNVIVLSREQYESAGMQMGSLQLETLFETISTTGFLNVPQENQIVVSSYLGGYASSTPLLPGDIVKRGQLLLQLTNPEIVTIQKDYLVAKQSLAYLKTVFDRQVTLEREKISSKDKLLLAESEYKNMLATKAALEQTLLLNNINPDKVSAETITPVISLYSPIGGVVTSMEAVNGQMVNPGEPLFQIVNTDHMHLEMKVFEQDVALVRPGQKVKFTIPDSRSGEFMGEIFLVGKYIDKQDRTVAIHAHPDEITLLPRFYGMFVEADIVIADRKAECVPISALASGDGDSFVFIERSETENELTFERIPVQVGFITETFAEILPESLSVLKGKRILVKGAYGLMQE